MAPAPLVLVIDDSSAVSELCELILGEASYRVASAPDGEVGLQLVRELAPDLVLVDIMLPEVDGLTLLDRLRELPSPPPALAMSGFDAFETEALARGARGFVRKPIDSGDLLAAVEAALQGRPLSPDVLRHAQERVLSHRREASASREALLARVRLDDADLNDRLRFLVRWLAHRFEVATVFVAVRRGDHIRFQAAFGGEPEMVEGGEIDAELTLCALVTDAGGPLVLHDASVSRALADHPVLRMGFRFYAGVPVRTVDGVVLGTLCLFDRHPHFLHGEDLVLLEMLADGVAERIRGLAGVPGAGDGALAAPGVFSRDLFRSMIAAEIKHVRRDGGGLELAIVDLVPGPGGHRAAAEAAYAAAPARRSAAGELAPGALGLLWGAPSSEQARDLMALALEGVRRVAPGLRGAGVAALGGGGSLADARAVESLADELRYRSVRGGGAVERVVLAGEAPRAGDAPRAGEPSAARAHR